MYRVCVWIAACNIKERQWLICSLPTKEKKRKISALHMSFQCIFFSLKKKKSLETCSLTCGSVYILSRCWYLLHFYIIKFQINPHYSNFFQILVNINLGKRKNICVTGCVRVQGVQTPVHSVDLDISKTCTHLIHPSEILQYDKLIKMCNLIYNWQS